MNTRKLRQAVCSHCAEEIEIADEIKDENLPSGKQLTTVFDLCSRIDDVCYMIKNKMSKEGKEYASKNGIDVADLLRGILSDINHADFWGEPIDDSMYQEAINRYKSFSSTFGVDLRDVTTALETMRDRNK